MEIVGRRLFNDTIATLDSDGFWTVLSIFKESRTYDGTNWEEMTLETKGIDRTLDKAYETSAKALEKKFAQGMKDGSGTSLFKE